MRFRVQYKALDVPSLEVEADEQSLEGDWLLLSKYSRGSGLVPIFRVRHADVHSVTIDPASLGQGPGGPKTTDASATGRVWALLKAADGIELDNAMKTVPGPNNIGASAEVTTTYEELKVGRGEPVPDAVQRNAASRIDVGAVVSDAAAIGRVWALMKAREGVPRGEASKSVPAPDKELASKEVARTYSSIGAASDGTVDSKSKTSASKRLGGWP
jgi:hypothetical protein